MRSFFSALAALLSLLLALVAVPAFWVDRNIVQEDGFAAIAGPLGSDKQFQSALSSALARASLSGSQLSGPLQAAAQPVVESLAKSATTLPGYDAAWTETLRRSHRLTFADPSTLPPEADGANSLTLDVAPLVDLVLKKVSSSVGVPVAAPKQALVSVGQSSQRQLIDRLKTYAPLGYWLAAGALIAFLLGLVLARRRGTMLLLTGVGLALVAWLWKIGEGLGVQFAQGTSSGSQVADLFKRQFAAAAAQSFDGWIITALIVAAAMAVLGLVLRVFARR